MSPENKDRLESEREFMNARSSHNQRAHLSKYYRTTDASRTFLHELLARHAGPGKTALEYGCGYNTLAIKLAESGSHVTAIDISDEAVRISKEQAEKAGVDKADFLRMNAERLTFENASFDLVCGMGVLHHLDLEKALEEISRVLKPGGAAIFYEPMGHNPIVNLYRRLTPKLRTPDEHPLKQGDFNLMKRHFGHTDFHFFNLLSTLAFPLAKNARFDPVLGFLTDIDKRLLAHFPALGKYSWIVVMELMKQEH